LAVDVLHQQPGALAAGVVDVGVGAALVDHQKFGVGAVYLQGDGAAHLLGSQSRCPGKTSSQNSSRASAWFQTPAAVRLARVPRSASKGCRVISAPPPSSRASTRAVRASRAEAAAAPRVARAWVRSASVQAALSQAAARARLTARGTRAGVRGAQASVMASSWAWVAGTSRSAPSAVRARP